MLRFLSIFLLSSLPPAWAGGGPPTVDLVLGVFGSFNADLRLLGGIVAADLDFRKNFDPDLVARFGPPILPIPNRSFYPGLRVRPVVAEDGANESVAVWATSSFIFGANGYPAVNGLLGPVDSGTGLATAASAGAFELNQICVGPNAAELSDKTRFPFFFRTGSSGGVLGRAMWAYVEFFRFRSFSMLTVVQVIEVAVRDAILAAAASAQQSDAIAGRSIPDTGADELADQEEWQSAVAWARRARSRLVMVLCSQQMLETLPLYLPDHGLGAPQFQLLFSIQLCSGKCTATLAGAHAILIALQFGPLVSFLGMLMKLNETDFTAGIERYAFDRWRSEPTLRFDAGRIPQAVIRAMPPIDAIMGMVGIFNAYTVFVRAFGELLNEGTPPEDIRGERLRAKMAQTDLQALLSRVTFDENQDDAGVAMSFASLQVHPAATGALQAHYMPLASCRRGKAADGTSIYALVPVAAAPWATGEVSVSAPAELTECPPGKYLSATDAGPTVCRDCSTGTFSNASDQTECDRCPAGTFGDESVGGCSLCPRGHYNPDKGSTSCIVCMPGSVAGAQGSVACELCPYGTYASTPQGGATSCVACGEGLTTAVVASLSADACVCAEGSYKPLQGGACKPCGRGLSCPVGSEEANIPAAPGGSAPGPYPEVSPGYFVNRGDPFSVYACKLDLVCPGGPPESCAPHHTGLVCADCVAGYYRSPNSLCKACAVSDSTPIVLALLVMLLCIFGLALYSQHDEGSQRLTVVTAVLAAGQLVSCVQALSVIQQLKVVWMEPLLSLWQLAGFFSFDFDMLKVQCVLRSDQPVANFLMQLLGVPVVAVVLAVTVLCTTNCRRCRRNGHKAAVRRCAFNVDRYLNLLGLMFVMTYISITVAVLRPLICKRHPNGLSSMASRLTVLCWGSEAHRVLVALSALGVVCYPVALLASVAHATLQYPRKAASGSLSHLSRFRFIFARFTPACYYWGFWYLLRNLALALVPVVSVNSGTWQMVLLFLIVLPFHTAEAALLPWRTRLANLSELSSLAGLLLLLQVTGFLIGAQTGGDPRMVSFMFLGVVVLILTATMAVVVFALARTCAPGMQYAAFLCHHKEGGGSLARWFKIQVQAVSKAHVFLDSDQLEELDLIVDTVHCRTKNLLILLTRFTLSRIWCAAEIASAVLHKVPIVQVACCDYVPCDADFLEKLDDLWSETQKHSVVQYGITLDHIRKAYGHLLAMDCVELKRFAPTDVQRAAVFRALHMCGICAPSLPTKAAVKTPARIVVAGASNDAEARTTCEVLRHLVQLRLDATVVAVHSGSDATAHRLGAAYLLVVLTRGLLQDAAFVEVGLAFDAARRQTPIELVTALADTNFAFPGAAFFEALAPQEDGERLANFFRRVFNILALPLSPHGSEGIMGAQVGELCRRFKAARLTAEDRSFSDAAAASLGPAAASVDSAGARGAGRAVHFEEAASVRAAGGTSSAPAVFWDVQSALEVSSDEEPSPHDPIRTLV